MMTSSCRQARQAVRISLDSLNALLRGAGIAPVGQHGLPVAGEPASAQEGPVVGHVQTFVEAHLAEDLSVDRLAAVADLSPSSLTRRFRREAGTTPWHYVLEARVEAAKRLLAETDRSLVRIAIDTGFYDQAHFVRTFNRLEGQTPGAYRTQDEDASGPAQ
jgi:transcriptional regulator GlxA family with amidase domain